MTKKNSNRLLFASMGILVAYVTYSLIRRYSLRPVNRLEARAKYVQGFGNLIIIFV